MSVILSILLVLAPAVAFAQPAKRPTKQPAEPDPAVVQLLSVVSDAEKPLPDRVQAALALGRRRDPGARAGLEPCLSDPQAAIRAAVARALGQIGDVAALSALRALKNDREQAVREAVDDAIDGLGGDPDAPIDWTKVRRVIRLGELAIAEDALPAPPAAPAGTTAAPATASAAPATASAAPATASAAPARAPARTSAGVSRPLRSRSRFATRCDGFPLSISSGRAALPPRSARRSRGVASRHSDSKAPCRRSAIVRTREAPASSPRSRSCCRASATGTSA